MWFIHKRSVTSSTVASMGLWHLQEKNWVEADSEGQCLPLVLRSVSEFRGIRLHPHQPGTLF